MARLVKKMFLIYVISSDNWFLHTESQLRKSTLVVVLLNK